VFHPHSVATNIAALTRMLCLIFPYSVQVKLYYYWLRRCNIRVIYTISVLMASQIVRLVY